MCTHMLDRVSVGRRREARQTGRDMLHGMGRDRTRVLVCAAASLVLIVAATLVMDWYRATFGVGEEVSRIAIDLTSIQTCDAIHVCTAAPLSPPGMFSTLASVTMWSSLAFAALVAYQAGVRLLTGNANDTVARLGYMFALTTLSIAIATAYMFGAETDGPGVQIAAHMGAALHRTWAPLTLIIGLIGGFATLYMSVAPDSTDLGDTYRPVTIVNLRAAVGDRPVTQSMAIPAAARAATRPLRPGGRIGTVPPTGDTPPARPANPLLAEFEAIASRSNEQTQPGTLGAGIGRSNLETHPTGEMPAATPRKPPSGKNPVLSGAAPGSGPLPRLTTGQRHVTAQSPAARRAPGGPVAQRPPTGQPAPGQPAPGPSAPGPSAPGPSAPGPSALGQPAPGRRVPTPVPGQRPVTGTYPVPRRPPTEPLPGTRRLTTAQIPAAVPATTGRLPVIGPATITSQVPLIEPTPTGQGMAAGHKSGPIVIPEHLRKRLSYVAITAELTGGGIDARREDGTLRLVLWRDVVGVVVRRMPPLFDNALFVDIVSTARSTLRILPWTRLTGDPIAGEGDARPIRIVEYILARCPKAKLDPATRQFLDTGEPAQIPDLETLRAHDARLA
jgi:hypothetical protein